MAKKIKLKDSVMESMRDTLKVGTVVGGMFASRKFINLKGMAAKQFPNSPMIAQAVNPGVKLLTGFAANIAGQQFQVPFISWLGWGMMADGTIEGLRMLTTKKEGGNYLPSISSSPSVIDRQLKNSVSMQPSSNGMGRKKQVGVAGTTFDEFAEVN